ncbi:MULTISPECIES: succinate dehydrogenase assembly factor 2 [unclassified Phaeobacter]|uniref:FAD assembly factor SdhE n=1 Tax=unclassified Phaeobacter TaxID=2621772 RepID=UPI003A88DE79
MSELPAHRLKRLQMRSMRRGIKEMDILLSAYAERTLVTMGPADLDLYDLLLQENDQDLYQWVTGQVAPPDRFSALIDDIAQTHQKE